VLQGSDVTGHLDGQGFGVLEISTQRDGEFLRLVLGGELDLSSAPHLVRYCADLRLDAPGGICVDLAELEFVDAAGLGSLVQVRTALDRRGGTLHVCRPRQLVRRVLALTQLDLALSVDPPLHQTAAVAGDRAG
jgi:anti-sigma B factor antagonist